MTSFFSRRTIRFGALALLLLVLAALLLWPQNMNTIFLRCREFYARGEYEVASKQLARSLRSNPDWHEARKFLIEIQLEQRDSVSALANLIFLLEAGQNCADSYAVLDQLAESPELEQGRSLLREKLTDNPEAKQTRLLFFQLELQVGNLPGALEQLGALAQWGNSSRTRENSIARICGRQAWEEFMNKLLTADPQWQWPREMKLLHALEHRNLELSLEYYSDLENTGSAPEDLAMGTLALALGQDLAAALALARDTGNALWLDTVLTKAESLEAPDLAQHLPELLALAPAEPRLQVLSALKLLPPQEGLDFLLGLEAEGFVPASLERYLEDKIRLLREAQVFDFKYLNFLDNSSLPPFSLIDLALECRLSSPGGLLELADYLEGLPVIFNRLDTALLREVAAFSGPAPKVMWQSSDTDGFPLALSLSPNGKWLTCNYWNQTIVIDLANGTETVLPVVVGQWHWSPDSRRGAAISAGALVTNILTLTPGSGKLLKEIALPGNYMLLGWLGKDNLALSETDGKQARVASLNVKNGDLQWLGKPRNGWPTVNPAGKLVWIIPEGGSLRIVAEKSDKVYPTSLDEDFLWNCPPGDWFPGGKRVFFESPFSPQVGFILDLEVGSFTQVNLPSPHTTGNWADSRSTIEFRPLNDLPANTRFLYKTDLVNGKSKYLGVLAKPYTGRLVIIDNLYPSQPLWGGVVFSTAGDIVALADGTGITVYKLK